MDTEQLRNKIEETISVIHGLECTLNENELSEDTQIVFLKVIEDYRERLNTLQAHERLITRHLDSIEQLKYIANHKLSYGLSEKSVQKIQSLYVNKIHSLLKKSEEY